MNLGTSSLNLYYLILIDVKKAAKVLHGKGQVQHCPR